MKIHHERDIEKIAAIDPAKYEDIPLQPLVVYALYWLHEWELRRTIEAVAVLSWRLFPMKFSMVGWPQYPDQLRTNRSLMQCGPKYRNWLTGAAVNGYSLNPRGIEKAHELIAQIGVPVLKDGSSADFTPLVERNEPKGSARTIEPAREVAKARQGRLFQKWNEGVLGERDLIHVHALLGVFDHTPKKIKAKKMKDLERAAEDICDEEMLRFFRDVRDTFPVLFMS
jgi:hypothetical protein